MWVIIYHCPECDRNYGSTEEFSHDHCYEEPDVSVAEKLCPDCSAKKGKK